MKFIYFLGIDVSKKTLDVALYVKDEKRFYYGQFNNNPAGFKLLFKWLGKYTSHIYQQCIICLEHTGIYSLPLCIFFQEKSLTFSLQPALQIKRSMGIQRGKNDKVDAHMIARYAYLYREELSPSILPSRSLLRLKSLLSYRERLVRSKVALQTAYKELNIYGANKTDKLILHDSLHQIDHLKKSIQRVDKKIQQIITNDPQLKRTFELVTSVKGIGLQIGTHLIVATHCFTRFDSWRKFSCYCGLAPFEYSSGSSIRGKTKVSYLGNKKLKALIGNGLASAIQHDPELSGYYRRKVKEGKHKMSVQNAIKNKLISRVFATVKRGTPYVILDKYAA